MARGWGPLGLGAPALTSVSSTLLLPTNPCPQASFRSAPRWLEPLRSDHVQHHSVVSSRLLWKECASKGVFQSPLRYLRRQTPGWTQRRSWVRGCEGAWSWWGRDAWGRDQEAAANGQSRVGPGSGGTLAMKLRVSWGHRAAWFHPQWHLHVGALRAAQVVYLGLTWGEVITGSTP